MNDNYQDPSATDRNAPPPPVDNFKDDFGSGGDFGAGAGGAGASAYGERLYALRRLSTVLTLVAA